MGKFTARLKQPNWATKDYIADFVRDRDFDNKLKNLNKNVTSNKSQHILDENEFIKLHDNIRKITNISLKSFYR